MINMDNASLPADQPLIEEEIVIFLLDHIIEVFLILL